METFYIKTAVGVIGFLLIAIGGDFYRRLFGLKTRVLVLEEKMTSFEIAQALSNRDIAGVRKDIAESKTLAESTIVPTLQQLATTVAVLNDRLQRHMNGGKNEGS